MAREQRRALAVCVWSQNGQAKRGCGNYYILQKSGVLYRPDEADDIGEQEEEGMATHPRRPRTARAGATTPRREEATPRKKAGRPPGPPSTIINLRLPLELLARLGRSIDRLETHTGLQAHRGMMARRALELFLETHATGESASETQEAQR